MAFGAVDEQARVEPAADEASAVAVYPADGVIEAPTVELRLDVTDPELTAEQKEILRLKEQLANLVGQQDVEPVVDELTKPGDAGNILIHFLEDGFSALGRVWYRGDELEFEVGSQAYRDTFNKNGVSWLELRGNEFGQVDRFGKIMFRNGPWPGKSYTDGTYEALRREAGEGTIPPPSKAELEAAEKARKRRAAPRLPVIA